MVYIINACLIVFWQLLIPERNKSKKKLLCILYCIQWILISGLRDLSVGPDTLAYKHDFDKVWNNSWGHWFNVFRDYLHGVEGIKDPGYNLFVKGLQIFIGKSYTLYLLLIACIFTIPMTIWIYKYSDNPCLSFLIYSALFYSFFAITGIRQTIATALVVFGGYACVKKKKYFFLLLLHLVAFFIHKSSICFVVFYMVPLIKKIDWKFWTISIVILLLSWLFRGQLMRFFGTTMGYENYIEQFEGAETGTFTFFMLIILGATMFLYPFTNKDNVVRDMVMGLVLAFFFIPLTYIDPSAMRIVQYFSIFILLLVPCLIKTLNEQTQLIANSVCYIILIAYLVLLNPQYTFVFM